jgi:hypothetical protein
MLTGVATAGARGDESLIRIQYRDLIDDSVYGHSGRPASEVLEELELATPEGIARRAVEDELREALAKLRTEINGADEKAGLAALKKKQSKAEKIEHILEDEETLSRWAHDYQQENEKALSAAAKLARADIQPFVVDIEPVCEPAAVVLNDALAQKDPTTFNGNLIELARFYPPGRAEPGWADLLRTRRFVVYTDGNAYCRLFLPGTSADDAWTRAYPVIRHVLRSLFKVDAPATSTLAVDVYAYENDIASTTFTLHLQKGTRAVAAQDLATPQGLKPLKLSALAHFFTNGLTLEGCGVDEAGDLVLIGSKGSRAPTLEKHPIELSDLAIAYRASAYAGRGESYMSLDRSEDKDFVNVNFGGRLQDTRMGWVAYRCDVRFKTVGDDVDAVTFEDLSKVIAEQMPDYMCQQRRMFADPAFLNLSGEETRFWFYPDDFKVVTGQDGRSCLVTRPRFTAAAERQKSLNAQGQPLDTKTPPWTSLTLDHFNKNYDRFGTLFPEVAELDDAARLLGVAEWLYQANRAGKIALDLDELLTLTLPMNPTPRRREQLRMEYAVKKQATPVEYRAYCYSTLRGRADFDRDYKSYLKPDSPWSIFRVTTGGLDYSARKAVGQAKSAEGKYQAALKEGVTNPEAFQGPDGKLLKSSRGFEQRPPIEPPPRTPLSASTPEPGPGAGDSSSLISHFKMPFGDPVESIVVRQGNRARFQKVRSDVYFGKTDVHSVWLSEHGTPERFACSTTKGVVTFTLAEQKGVFIAKAVPKPRTLTAVEADLLGNALTQGKRTPSEVWKLVPVDTDVRAIDFTPQGEALIYYRENRVDVLRVYKGEEPAAVFSGEQATARLREASREKARTYSVEGKVELLYASQEGDAVVFQIGKRDPIRVDAIEYGKWLSGSADAVPPKPLSDVFEALAKSGGELVVMRDAVQTQPRRLKNHDFFGTLMGAVHRDSVARYDLAIERLQLSDDELQGQIDEIGKSAAKLTPAQKRMLDDVLTELELAKKMSASERAAKVTELEAKRQTELAEGIVFTTDRDAVQLSTALKRKLPKLRISSDDPSPIVPGRVLSEARVSRPGDVALAVPPGEAGVDDKAILKTVIGAFEQAKIPLVRSPAELKTVGNVIIITAHNNQQLFDYIQTLGDHMIDGKSALDGKMLMLITCFEDGNPNMISEFLRRYNCGGVHVQTERVNKDAVKRALIEFGNDLGAIKEGDPPQRLRDIYDGAIRRLLERDDPSLEFLKPELEKLLKAHVQWCGLSCGGTGCT